MNENQALGLMNDNSAVRGIMKGSVISFRNSGLNGPKYLPSTNHFSRKGHIHQSHA